MFETTVLYNTSMHTTHDKTQVAKHSAVWDAAVDNDNNKIPVFLNHHDKEYEIVGFDVLREGYPEVELITGLNKNWN